MTSGTLHSVMDNSAKRVMVSLSLETEIGIWGLQRRLGRVPERNDL